MEHNINLRKENIFGVSGVSAGYTGVLSNCQLGKKIYLISFRSLKRIFNKLLSFTFSSEGLSGG